jgi:hypothetical protein
MRTETKGFLVSLALFALCAVAFIGLNGCTDAEGRAIPHDGPKPPFCVWVPVTGKSMLPKYPEAHLIEVNITFPFDQLRVGDVVVFWDYRRDGGASYTYHPIIGKQGKYFITQGLNPETNPRPDDSWLTPDNYIGRATGKSTLVLFAPNP